jgi:hypothetical protein
VIIMHHINATNANGLQALTIAEKWKKCCGLATQMRAIGAMQTVMPQSQWDPEE